MEVSNSRARLIHGDCLEYLKELKIDAIVSDPPYGCNLLSKTGVTGSTKNSKAGIKGRVYDPIIGDDKPFDPSPLLNFPYVILWGGNWFCSKLPDSSCWLVWDKRKGTASNNMADCELAYTNLKGPSKLFHHRWMGMLRDSEKGINDRFHPTQKPIALMRWCLSFLPKGITICDPYMGSGTTGVACLQLGFKFVGIEIHEGYYNLAKNRIMNKTHAIFKPIKG